MEASLRREQGKKVCIILPKMLIDLWECMPENIRFLTWYTNYKTLPAHTIYGEKYSFSFKTFLQLQRQKNPLVSAQVEFRQTAYKTA